MTTKQAWGSFWLLALIWGSSFLFIRIGVEQLPPFQLVFLRTSIAAIGLTLVIALRGRRPAITWRSVCDLVFLGTVNTIIPFVLITWGETRIESSLASVLQGTVALFTLVRAHFTFGDERITLRKLAGLGIGFLGVALLTSRSSGGGIGQSDPTGHLLGQAAIIGASFCYGLGGIYGRKVLQQRLEPIAVAAGAMSVAAVLSGAIMWGWAFLGGPPPASISQLTPEVLGATLALGVVNTFGAYLLFYPLVATLGASRTSMVTYVFPVVGLVLGAIFLGERIDLLLVIGALMIAGGIAIVNLNLRSLFRWIEQAKIGRSARRDTPAVSDVGGERPSPQSVQACQR
jgi:drug/metabolite transporter (DMT)-like permease